MRSSLSFLVCFCVTVAPLYACGDQAPSPPPVDPNASSPQPAEPPAGAAGAGTAAGGQGTSHPRSAQLPANHPPVGGPHGMTGDPAGGPMPAPSPSTPSFDPEHPVAGGVRFEVSEPFEYQTPRSSMRIAEYAVGEDGAVMGIFHFPGSGGSIQANIDRWVGQMQPPEGRSAEELVSIRELRSHGLPVVVVSALGNFAGGMGSPPAEDQRLLAAIVTGPRGPVFFKLLGPREAVDGAEASFDAMVSSLQAAD